REQEASYDTPGVLEDWSNDLSKLHGAYNNAYCARNLVGSVPQLPNTFLGLMARWMIGIAQRMLFWYTPQIRFFNERAASILDRIGVLEDREFRVVLALANRIEKLERETRLMRAATPAASVSTGRADAAPSGETAAAPQHPRNGPYSRSRLDTKDFFFQLQG